VVKGNIEDPVTHHLLYQRDTKDRVDSRMKRELQIINNRAHDSKKNTQ
jgi:hypothetical protein